jgi:protein-tyrosine phosphatase
VKKRVLFICLGNICRSPLAEALFIHRIKERGLEHLFEVDSCGTNGFHNGELADERTRKNAQKHDVEVPSISRQLTFGDVLDFDHLITMASDVQFQVQHFCETDEQKNKVQLFRKFDVSAPNSNVPDPWYGGEDGFEDVFHIIKNNIDVWIDHILEE